MTIQQSVISNNADSRTNLLVLLRISEQLIRNTGELPEPPSEQTKEEILLGLVGYIISCSVFCRLGIMFSGGAYSTVGRTTFSLVYVYE
jgi:hypothetical protein